MENLQLEQTSKQWCSSMFHQRSDWRQQCYSRIEIMSLLSHWFKQFTWEKRMSALRVFSQKFALWTPVEYMWWRKGCSYDDCAH